MGRGRGAVSLHCAVGGAWDRVIGCRGLDSDVGA